MTWNVKVHVEAAKQLEAIPPDRRKRILNDIDELAQDPFRGLVKPLKGAAYKACTAKCQAAIASSSSPSMVSEQLRSCRCFCAMSAPTADYSDRKVSTG